MSRRARLVVLIVSAILIFALAASALVSGRTGRCPVTGLDGPDGTPAVIQPQPAGK